MADLLLGKFIQNDSITKEKLNLVDPVLDRDPVTKSYLDSLGISNGIQELWESMQAGFALLEQLSATTYPDLKPSWVNSNSFAVVTNGSGATANATNKTISILANNTGAGASLKQYLNLSTFPNYKTGDQLLIRMLVTESVLNTILPSTVELSMVVDGNPVEIYPETTNFGGNDLILEIIFPYTVINTESLLEVTLSIKSDAPIQPSNTVISWNFFGVFNTEDRYKDIINKVSYDLKNVATLYAFSERRPVISRVNITNSSDNTARLQDEFDLATQTSGEIIIPRNSTILIKDTVFINGGLRIIGGGNTTVFNPDYSSLNLEMFNINTPDSVIFENFTVWRLNGSSNATSFRFNPLNVNSNSVFRNLTFLNIPQGLFLDYSDNLTIDGCVFGSGQNALNIGHVDQASIKNLTVRRSMFNSVNNINIHAKSANNLTISNSFFRNVAPSSVYAARPLVLDITAGNHSNVKIVENSFEAFREFAIRGAVTGSATLSKILISNNIFKDKSPIIPIVANAGVMFFTSTTPYALSNVIVENNDIETKLTAFDFRNIDYLNINHNTVKRDAAGTFTSAKVYNIVDVPNQVRLGNIFEPGLTIS